MRLWEFLQCFFFFPFLQVTKRDEDSSLMQLKEEFRTYEALRREHDSQIVQIAMEGGLRIAPDQWSSLLYGDQSHKSHMQSIIDKVGGESITGMPFLLHFLLIAILSFFKKKQIIPGLFLTESKCHDFHIYNSRRK